MQIPKQMRQFEQSHALIVSSGSKHGRLLLAHDGFVDDVYEYTEAKATYSDDEGGFMTSGKNGVYAMGGVHTEQEQQQRTHYADKLVEAIQKITLSLTIDELYLCAPRQTLALIEQRLTPTLKRKVYGELASNIAHEHPITVLQRLTRLSDAKHPYTDSASVLRSHTYLRTAKSGANTLGRHNLDRVLVQARWHNTPAHA